NQDGVQDLAVASVMAGTVEILIGRRAGSFSLQGSLAVGKRPVSVAAGDFDGDGRSDLASVNAESHDVSVLYGRDQGRFDEERRVHLEDQGYRPPGLFHQHWIAAGDLNADGRTDLV